MPNAFHTLNITYRDIASLFLYQLYIKRTETVKENAL